MAKASDNVFPRVILGVNSTDQAAPADASWRVYSKADGVYARSSNSTVGPFGAGGGLADQGTFTYLDATEAAAPSTPASGKVRIYAKSDGRVYSKDDAGVEYGPFDTAGGGTGDFPAYGVDWMRYPQRLGLVGGTVAAHVQNPLNVSDGDPSSAANSTTVTVPQDHRVDLGAEREVSSCYVAYSSSNNRSDDGELQYSNDNSSWTAAATWTNDSTTSRLHTFSPVTARYWRVYTTQTGSPGGTGVNIVDFRLINGGTDYAAGLTPTFLEATNNATNATDRNDSTSANQTNGNQPQWIRVDLASARTVHAVRIMFASTYANIGGNAKVQWSSNDSAWNDIGDPALVVSQPEVRFDFAAQSARYWRVYTTAAYVSGNGLNWATFEVWGE